ncbi:hypothetical protein CCACVL1_14682 [Corchorus capsularis]|uniref:Uncharacterized protein n=1 Tax=Corchorus capsularis TaxID=210143 RepID=A0A1R3I621_COCAP|nr:hypothetical protein CCACVL1_14682 [Corchorus capsularis]
MEERTLATSTERGGAKKMTHMGE